LVVGRGLERAIRVGQAFLEAIGLVAVVQRLGDRARSGAISDRLVGLVALGVVDVDRTALGVAGLGIADQQIASVVGVANGLARRLAVGRIVVLIRAPPGIVVDVDTTLALRAGACGQIADLVVVVGDRFAQRACLGLDPVGQVVGEGVDMPIGVGDRFEIVPGVVDVGGHAAGRVGRRVHPSEGVIGGLGRAPQRVGRADRLALGVIARMGRLAPVRLVVLARQDAGHGGAVATQVECVFLA